MTKLFKFTDMVGYGKLADPKIALANRKWSSHLIDVGGAGRVQFEARSSDPMQVYLISPDGEECFWQEGKVIEFDAKLVDVSGIEIRATEKFWMKSLLHDFHERVDPVPATVSVIIEDVDPVAAVVQREVMKALRAYGASEEELKELADDIANGDLEFDPDEGFDFGDGSMEDEEPESDEPVEPPQSPPAATPPAPDPKGPAVAPEPVAPPKPA